MKTSQKISTLLITAFSLSAITGCDKKATEIPVPVLTTLSVTEITEISAKSGGDISSDQGSNISARGICWKKDGNPTISDNKTIDGTGIGRFNSTITGLTAGSTYYVRAYATNSSGTNYGNTITFKTLSLATPFTDIDGNVYNTVNIGSQTWMAENLRTTRFRSGESISKVEVDSLWKKATFAAFCSYNNLDENGTKYGRLYNWAAVKDVRNIAPLGWHIPSAAEWDILVNYLGGENSAGAKLKEMGTTNWYLNSTSVTNESRFTALPGGSRDAGGAFASITKTGYWWCSSEYNSTTADLRKMYNDDNSVHNDNKLKSYGLSVRCIKDSN